MNRRRLSDDERTLWTHVTKSIAPLKKRAAIDEEPLAAKPKSSAASAPAKLRSKPVALPSYTPVSPPPPALNFFKFA